MVRSNDLGMSEIPIYVAGYHRALVGDIQITPNGNQQNNFEIRRFREHSTAIFYLTITKQSISL